jgi:hypothetical protein
MTGGNDMTGTAGIGVGQREPCVSYFLVALLAAAACLVLCPGIGYGQQGKTPPPQLETLDLKKFGRSTDVTNKWMPMKPGMRWIYEGTTVEDDGKIVPHRIEITTTDLVKIIGGVRTVVSYDLDYSDHELVEAELAFYAQDTNGNVWRFGEYPEEYEDGKLIKAPAWIHGFEGAKAGIMMQSEPRLGTPSYSQGWGPAVGWTDRGITYLMGQKVAVPAGSYDDVLVIKETARGEKDAEQLKYYAPGVGNVQVGWTGSGEKTKEILQLVKAEQLDPMALADIRAKALKLEKSAYKQSKNAYARTSPATPNVIGKSDR